MIRPSPILCPEIHGESGLDGPQGGPLLPPASQQASPIKAVIAMYQAISRAWHEQQLAQEPKKVKWVSHSSCLMLQCHWMSAA